MGSGVLVSGDGIVLTNHHVVEEATDIRVTSSDDREFDAEVVGSDAKSDLAVLRLKGDLSGLNPLTLGNSAQLRLGDIVLAIGNPFGVGQTVTMGIVSAKGRADVGIVDYEDFIQTDAAINPGNSGGALVNMRGELVGINTAILSRSGGYQGIGFAIPSNMAHPIMKSLVEHGRVARGFLGIGIQDIDNELMKAMKLPDGRGVLVTQVQKDSAAAKAGLERGDVVLAVDGSPVDSTGNLRNLIAAKGADAKVLLTVLRRGKTLSLDVELSELPSDEPVTSSPTVEGGSALGMKLAPLDPQARQRFRLPKDAPGKVVIVEVKRGSRAAEAGLRPGDVILEVDRNVISGLSGAEKALSNAKDAVLVVISRGGGNRYIVVQPASTK
jgi:serine protease Do